MCEKKKKSLFRNDSCAAIKKEKRYGLIKLGKKQASSEYVLYNWMKFFSSLSCLPSFKCLPFYSTYSSNLLLSIPICYSLIENYTFKFVYPFFIIFMLYVEHYQHLDSREIKKKKQQEEGYKLYIHIFSRIETRLVFTTFFSFIYSYPSSKHLWNLFSKHEKKGEIESEWRIHIKRW